MNLHQLAAGIREPHAHRPLGVVNDHHVVMAVNEVSYPWHEHPDSDELFLIVDGRLKLDRRDGPSIELGPGDFYRVPAGTAHRTTPIGRCVNLVFEAVDTETRFLDVRTDEEHEAG